MSGSPNCWRPRSTWTLWWTRSRFGSRGLVANAPADDQLVDAAEIARMTSMSRRWVYDHKENLGVVMAGTGPRPRLLFDPQVVRARMVGGEASDAMPARPNKPASHRLLEDEVPLLPVKSRAA
jgi:hypothetical protein